MAGLFGSGNADAAAVDDGGNRQKVLLAVAGIALVGLLAVLFLPKLLSGSDDTSTTGLPSPAAKRVPSPAPVTSNPTDPTAGSGDLVPADAAGDPFAPLPEEAEASAAANPTTSVVAPAAGTTVVPPTGTATATNGTTTGTAGGGTTANGTTTTTTTPTAATGAKPVQVMRLSGTAATVEVDSKPYTVTKGATFAADYTCVAVTDKGVQISHGGSTRTLVAGELQTF